MKPKRKILYARWSKSENDMVFGWPDHAFNGRLLSYFFCTKPFNHKGDLEKSLIEELEDRGYDIKTFKFSICKKEVPKCAIERDSKDDDCGHLNKVSPLPSKDTKKEGGE